MAPEPPHTLLEDYFASLPSDLLLEQITSALASDTVDIRLVLEAAALLHPRVRVREDLRVIAHTHYRPLLRRWKSQNPGCSLTLLPALQAYIVLVKPQSPPNPGTTARRDHARRIRWDRVRRRRDFLKSSPADWSAYGVTLNLQPLADPGFNWSEARQLLLEIDAIGENANLWIHDAEERGPHLERVNSLAWQLLKAVEVESLRRAVPGADDKDAIYESTLAVLKEEAKTARYQFIRSAEQSAQRAYAQGMLRTGGLTMAILCGIIGTCFIIFSVPAVSAIALPAGAIGAIISVFQRMHTGKSVADYQTAGDRLRVFGAIRTMIGGVFGMFVFALIASGLAGPTLEIPPGGQGLAYAGVVGFLAGFNERLAQDVITKSSQRLAASGAPTTDRPDAQGL